MRAPARLLALALLATAAAAAPSARADEVPITPAAREHFVAGVRMLKDPSGPRYEDAYQEFRAAYAASASPRILGNMGLCAMKLERDEEAVGAYEKYLAGVADLDAAERKQIEGDLNTLKASLVHLTITVDAGEVRVVDARTPVQGTPITNVYGPFAASPIRLGVHAGHHVITVKREGATATWELDVLPGSAAARAFTLLAPTARVTPPPPVEPPRAPEQKPPAAPADQLIRPTPTAVYVLAIVSAGTLLGGVITGTSALQKKNAFDDANTGQTPNQATALRSSGQKLNIATDVLLGATIAGAAVTTILYLTRPTVKAPAAGLLPRPFELRVGASPLGGAATLEAAF